MATKTKHPSSGAAAPAARPRIRITDTTLRDAHQSLWATRMRLNDILPVIDAIDRAGSVDPEAIRTALAQTEGFDSMLGKLTANEHGELNSTLFILAIDADKVCSVAQKVSLN